MTVVRSKTFRSGNSEAVRLPRDVAFGPDVELVIVRSGDVMTIYPAPATGLADMVARLETMPKPPAVEVRETDLPERPGL